MPQIICSCGRSVHVLKNKLAVCKCGRKYNIKVVIPEKRSFKKKGLLSFKTVPDLFW